MDDIDQASSVQKTGFSLGIFLFVFVGIFAYLNFLTPKSRQEILEMLLKGLQRLEYRGYDSAGKEGGFVGVGQILESDGRPLTTTDSTLSWGRVSLELRDRVNQRRCPNLCEVSGFD